MHAGVGDFADRIQTLDGRRAVQVRIDATTGVVRGGCDGDPIARRIESCRTTCAGDEWKAFLESVTDGGRVEIHVIVHTVDGARHSLADRRGHDVSRREILEGMCSLHDSFAGGVVQHRTLATHRLTDQRLLCRRLDSLPQHRRVELDELEIAQHETRAQRQGVSVTGDCRRVRRAREHLPIATGGDDHCARRHDADAHHFSRRAEHRDAHACNLALASWRHTKFEIERERVLEHLDACVDRVFVQRALNLRARLIASGVHDAGS